MKFFNQLLNLLNILLCMSLFSNRQEMFKSTTLILKVLHRINLRHPLNVIQFLVCVFLVLTKI